MILDFCCFIYDSIIVNIKLTGASPGQKMWGGHTYGEREARAYNGGLGAEPPAGSRGRAPGHEVRGRD